METGKRMIKTGDRVVYTSRKNGRKYLGFYGHQWTDKFGHKYVAIYSTQASDTQVLATPPIEDVELLTDELHMLYKLENA